MGVQNGGLESPLKIEEALKEIAIDYNVQKTEKGLKIKISDTVDIEYYDKNVFIKNGSVGLVFENSKDSVVVKRVALDKDDEEAETPIGRINGKIANVKFNATRIIDYGTTMVTEIDIECKGSCGGYDDRD